MTPQSLLGLSGSALTRNEGKGLQSCWECGGIVQRGEGGGDSLSLCPQGRASQRLLKGKKHLPESSSSGLAGKVTLGVEMNSGGASQERDRRQHKEGIRLLEVGALVRSELGKVGWVWVKTKKARISDKLKFGRFWSQKETS